MKIAITGANGYIGSALVTKCLDLKLDIVAVDINDTYVDKRANFKKIDIFDNKVDFYKEMEKPDVLIHLAWRNGFIHNDISHLDDLPKHYLFLKKMIDCGVKYVSVLGTMHEVGYYEGKIDENTSCNPMSLYGIAKNALRQLFFTMNTNDVNLHWLRAYYIVGDDLKSNSIFGKLIRSANEGNKEFPLNSGRMKYDFISLEELCKQIVAASIQSEVNGVINLCSGVPISLGERVEQFISDNNLDIKLNYGVFPDRPYDSPIVYGDNTRIMKIMSDVQDV